MFRLFRNVVAYRYLIWTFLVRDLKVKYRGSFFGYLWSLLEPLALVGVYYFVFVKLMGAKQPYYELRIMLGLLPWTFFSQVLMASSNSFRSNASLIRRVQVPREVYVVAVLCSSFVILCLNMLIVFPVMYLHSIPFGPMIFLWPLGMGLICTYALGIGLVVACANVIFRDVGYVLSVALRLGLYLSAALYPMSQVPVDKRFLFLFNPMAFSLVVSRAGFLNELPPSVEVWHAVSAIAVGVLILAGGTMIFYRWERRVVKFL